MCCRPEDAVLGSKPCYVKAQGSVTLAAAMAQNLADFFGSGDVVNMCTENSAAIAAAADVVLHESTAAMQHIWQYMSTVNQNELPNGWTYCAVVVCTTHSILLGSGPWNLSRVDYGRMFEAAKRQASMLH